jgi:hypothetical protein
MKQKSESAGSRHTSSMRGPGPDQWMSKSLPSVSVNTAQPRRAVLATWGPAALYIFDHLHIYSLGCTRIREMTERDQISYGLLC